MSWFVVHNTNNRRIIGIDIVEIKYLLIQPNGDGCVFFSILLGFDF
jgi:hypothetical protein